MKKRVISLLLIAAMVIMLLPVMALAANVEPMAVGDGVVGDFDYVTFSFDSRACNVYVSEDGGYYSVKDGQTLYLNYGDQISGRVEMKSGYAFDMIYINGDPYVSPDFTFTVQDGYNTVFVDTSDADTTIDLTFSFDDGECSVQYQNNTMNWQNAYDGEHITVPEGTYVSVKIATYSGYTLQYSTVAGKTYRAASFQTPILTSDGYLAIYTSRSSGTAPVITRFTASANPTVGETATLGITATGTSPLSYEWQMYYNGAWRDVYNGTYNGVSITNYNAATLYITPNSQGNFYFRCIVDNDYGEVTSGTMTITASAATKYITNATASGIAVPVTGGTPAKSANAGASSYYVSAIQWNPATVSFAANTQYTCWVTFTAYSGYTFGGSPVAYVNGNPAVVYSGTGSSQLLVYYVFPKTTVTTVPFNDIRVTDWFYKDVVSAYQKGLIEGTTSVTFSPSNNITYGEVIKLAACLHQMYNTGSVSLTGSGVNWYTPYMNYALNNGIISRDYTSVQSNLCNRQDFVDIFYKAMPATSYTAINSVANGAIPDYPYTGTDSCDHVYTFYRAGIVNGSGGYLFKATTYITRAEVATIITRMYDPASRISGLVLS